MVRLTCDARTQAYVARRTAEGMSKREIIRCLKRYVAREVFHALLDNSYCPPAPSQPNPATDANVIPLRVGVSR
jgi:transposase